MTSRVENVILLAVASGALLLSIHWIIQNVPTQTQTVDTSMDQAVNLESKPIASNTASNTHGRAPTNDQARLYQIAELETVIKQVTLEENDTLLLQPMLLADFEKLYDIALDRSASEPFFDALNQIINDHLPSQAAHTYSRLFKKYADYRAALAEQFYANQTTELDYNQLDSYRRQYFTHAEVEALFAEKTLVTNLFLETYLNETQQNVAQQHSDAEIKKWESELQALDTPLGEALRRDTITEMQANGSDENQILTFRARTEGWKAAEINTQRERKFSELRQKYNDYLTEKATIEQAGLTSDDKKKQQQALFNRLFNEEEQTALKAIPAVRELME